MTYSVGTAPGAPNTGDFNGGGKRDIAVRNVGSKSVSILINRGDGSFFPAVDIPLQGIPVTLNLADFDGDGKLDIVLGLSDASGVAVLLGKGDGSFQSPLLIPVGNGPRSTVEVTDLNGDGRPDIVLPLAGEGAIAVLINSGAAATTTSGTFFSAPTGSGSGSSGISVAGGGPTCALSHAAFIPTTGAAASPPTAIPGIVAYKFPHGLADFSTAGCTVGATLTITVTYPNALPYGTKYWKYGPTASLTSKSWANVRNPLKTSCGMNLL